MSRIDSALQRAEASHAQGAAAWRRPGPAVVPAAVAAPEDYASETGAGLPVVVDEGAYLPEVAAAPSAIAPRPVVPVPAEPIATAASVADMLRIADAAALRERGREGTLITEAGISSSSIEQYRRVAATLHHLQREQGVKRLMVASALPREGKTMTCVNLALTLATAYRRRVLIIDGDLRKPSVHESFGISQEGGLSRDLLTGDEPLRLVQVGHDVTVLTAARPEPNATAVLASRRMHDVIEAAAQQFDWVIIDSSPIGVISDASVLAAMVEAIVLVIGAGSTACRKVQHAIDTLGRERIIGAILNRVEERQLDVSKDHGYYYYGPGTDPV
jgi:protein-tyrosine kinase